MSGQSGYCSSVSIVTGALNEAPRAGSFAEAIAFTAGTDGPLACVFFSTAVFRLQPAASTMPTDTTPTVNNRTISASDFAKFYKISFDVNASQSIENTRSTVAKPLFCDK